MANEWSQYEGGLDRTGLACIGRITHVDSSARTVRAKTFGLQNTDDLDLYGVKILHSQWHLDGDEDVSIPREGSYGVILFVGPDSYWLGASTMQMSDGETQRDNQVELLPGDRVFKTTANNRIILRTGGTVEVQSTLLCRTFWLPSENLISAVCQNSELETAGGYLYWNLDNDDETTNLSFKAWESNNPSNAVSVDVGTVPAVNDEAGGGSIEGFPASDLILDIRQGAVDENLDFKPRSFRMSIKKDGSTYLDIGPGKFSMKIDAATGDVQFQTQGKLSGQVTGDVQLNAQGDATVQAGGKVSVTAGGDASVDATGDVAVKAGGNAKIDASKIMLNGSSGQVLTTVSSPLVDNITGAPSMGVETVTAG
jgi:hypothetical protein